MVSRTDGRFSRRLISDAYPCYIVCLRTLSFTALTMSRYGRPGFTISMSAPSLTSRSCNKEQRGFYGSLPLNRDQTPARAIESTHHSPNGESSCSRGQLIAASIPKRRFGLGSISVYRHIRIS